MAGERKWLHCIHCKTKTWFRPVAIRSREYACESAGHKIDLFAAQRRASAERKSKKIAKAKELGTYQSDAQKQKARQDRGAIFVDEDYMRFVKSLKCAVPSCTSGDVVDAHHAIHRSQGRDDRTCVPLCHYHHIGQYHGQLGSVEAALKKWGIDLTKVASHLYSKYRASALHQCRTSTSGSQDLTPTDADSAPSTS